PTPAPSSDVGWTLLPGGRACLRGPGDLATLEGLDLVAVLDVVVVLDQHAALEPRRDLAHVLLEALERGDGPLVHDGAVPDQADVGRAPDDAVGDVAAGDRAEPAGAERGSDLELAGDLLDDVGLQQAHQRVADV